MLGLTAVRVVAPRDIQAMTCVMVMLPPESIAMLNRVIGLA